MRVGGFDDFGDIQILESVSREYRGSNVAVHVEKLADSRALPVRMG